MFNTIHNMATKMITYHFWKTLFFVILVCISSQASPDGTVDEDHQAFTTDLVQDSHRHLWKAIKSLQTSVAFLTGKVGDIEKEQKHILGKLIQMNDKTEDFEVEVADLKTESRKIQQKVHAISNKTKSMHNTIHKMKSDMESEVMSMRDGDWAHQPTGCKCHFDKRRQDCACCKPGGCQCPSYNPHVCIRCADPISSCKTATPNWLEQPSGCRCYWDKTRNDCACCKHGGCACPSNNQHACTKCATRGCSSATAKWTKAPVGGRCYWKPEHYDCAVCKSGGCQCPQNKQHVCVKCGSRDCATIPA